jgi:hypothetical protein
MKHVLFELRFALLRLWLRGSVVVKALCYKPEGSIPDEVNF